MPCKTKTDLALGALNEARGLKYPDIGYLYYANVTGDGRSPAYRSIWCIVNAEGGIVRSHFNTTSSKAALALIAFSLTLTKSEAFAVILRCVHERGKMQTCALEELSRRGLWLNDDQKRQAGLQ